MNRIILHADVNSAFLSWSAVQMLKEGAEIDLRTVPSAVGGDEAARKGIILAKSIPAKRLGVQTGEPLWQARKKCPELIIVPGDYALYTRMSNAFMDMVRDFSPLCQQYSVDECFIDYTGMEKAFGPAPAAADRLRRRIRDELGFTVSIGIAHTKVLAKMAGELKKPDAVTTLWPEELPQKLWPLPVRELFMVGRATERRLHALNIHTIGDLAQADADMLCRHLGKNGFTLWQYANGLDRDPVVPSETIPLKSYSQSVTLPRDLRTEDQLLPVLSRLSTALSYRMRRGGACCSVVSLYLKDPTLQVTGHQKKLPRPSDVTGELYQALRTLFFQTYTGGPVRAMGIGFSDLCPVDGVSLSLFDDRSMQKKIAIDAAGDRIRSRYGGKALCPASALRSPDFSHLARYEPDSGRPRTFCPF